MSLTPPATSRSNSPTPVYVPPPSPQATSRSNSPTPEYCKENQPPETYQQTATRKQNDEEDLRPPQKQTRITDFFKKRSYYKTSTS